MAAILFFGPLYSVVCWRVYFPNLFCLFRFVASFHSNFWLPWRVFPNTRTFLFVSFSMRRAYAARRRRRRDVITHRRRRHRLSRNFTHRPFRALFSVYLHFESVRKNPNPMRECRQKAPKTRRCHHHRAVEHFRCQSCVNYAIKLSFRLFRASCKTLRSG